MLCQQVSEGQVGQEDLAGNHTRALCQVLYESQFDEEASVTCL